MMLMMLILMMSDIQHSIIATEFGSNRDPEAVDKIFISLRNVLSLPVHGYYHRTTVPQCNYSNTVV